MSQSIAKQVFPLEFFFRVITIEWTQKTVSFSLAIRALRGEERGATCLKLYPALSII